MSKLKARFTRACARTTCKLLSMREAGQGTTEYAILVGILAVIAMIAIAAFKDRISELWDAITNGVNGL